MFQLHWNGRTNGVWIEMCTNSECNTRQPLFSLSVSFSHSKLEINNNKICTFSHANFGQEKKTNKTKYYNEQFENYLEKCSTSFCVSNLRLCECLCVYTFISWVANFYFIENEKCTNNSISDATDSFSYYELDIQTPYIVHCECVSVCELHGCILRTYIFHGMS